MKSKFVAATLALILGIFGVHRFYLGRRFLGIVYFAIFFITLIISIEERAPAFLLPALLGFIDAVLLFVMPQEEFDERYNAKYLNRQRRGEWEEDRPVRKALPAAKNRPRSRRSELDEAIAHKKAGIDAFRAHDYENAIEAFEMALELRFEDPALHFNLACCYSLMEDGDKAFFHLEQAANYGFNDEKRISNHDALAFVRSHPDFDAFVKNDYRRVQKAPEPEPEPAPAVPPVVAADPVAMPTDVGMEQLDLLDQISQLGKLRDIGILTDEEFAEQKQKLLRN